MASGPAPDNLDDAWEQKLDDFWESLSEFDAIIRERAERPPTRLHVDTNHYSEVGAAAVVRFVLAAPTSE